MKCMNRALSVVTLFLCAAVFSGSLSADIDVYEFQTEEQRQQYRGLIRELRCPKCQNQDIADSNAPIAKDMRREVHRMIQSGRNHEEIVDFMVERFGEFVSYRPKVMPETYLLWYGPWVLVVIGLLSIVAVARARKARRGNGQDKVKVSDADHQQVETLLKRYGDSPVDKASEEAQVAEDKSGLIAGQTNDKGESR